MQPEPLTKFNGAYAWMRESPGWRDRYPVGPVRFQVRCSGCGRTADDQMLSRDNAPYTAADGTLIYERTHTFLCTLCMPEPKVCLEIAREIAQGLSDNIYERKS